MRRLLRATAALLVIVPMTITATGCGGKKKAAPATSAATTTAATTTAPSTTGTASKAYKLTATLTTAQAVPKPKGASGASGSFSATITLHGKIGTLAWHLSFAHLSGPATMAHVHLAPPGRPGPIVIPLCAPCKPNASGSFQGPIGGNVALLHALIGGGAYVNVHTKLNPQGEIRGQLKATSAPAGTGPTTTSGPTTTTSTGSGY
ncbi:MAG TPA: CHRD domain-containing protein [Gaiellaceae bacterium]